VGKKHSSWLLAENLVRRLVIALKTGHRMVILGQRPTRDGNCRMNTLPKSDFVQPEDSGRQEFFSIRELARRWRCSRGTVYNRLRRAGAMVLDFALPGKKGKKCVHVNVILQIERKQTRRMY
jgi:hypothetical protein